MNYNFLNELEPTAESIPKASQSILDEMKPKKEESVDQFIQALQLSMEETRKDDHILAVLYLLNDIVQKSINLEFEYFKDSVCNNLPSLFQVGYQKLKSKDIKKKVLTILEVWVKRSIFPQEFVNKISILCKNKEANKEELKFLDKETVEYARTSKKLASRVQKSISTYEKLNEIKSEIQESVGNSKNYSNELSEFELNLKSLKTILDEEFETLSSSLKLSSDILKNLDVSHLRLLIDFKSLIEREEKVKKVLSLLE